MHCRMSATTNSSNSLGHLLSGSDMSNYAVGLSQSQLGLKDYINLMHGHCIDILNYAVLIW